MTTITSTRIEQTAYLIYLNTCLGRLFAHPELKPHEQEFAKLQNNSDQATALGWIYVHIVLKLPEHRIDCLEQDLKTALRTLLPATSAVEEFLDEAVLLEVERATTETATRVFTEIADLLEKAPQTEPLIQKLKALQFAIGTIADTNCDIVPEDPIC